MGTDKIISGERVVDELNKILSTNLLKDFYCFIKRAFRHSLPELTALKPSGRNRGNTQKTILPHIEVVDNICPTLMMSVCVSCLLHDYRKSANQTI
jgi:tRNA nucleotidyltransferase (CCA-adding enzyme)